MNFKLPQIQRTTDAPFDSIISGELNLWELLNPA